MCTDTIEIQDLGLKGYQEALEIQLRYFNALVESKRNKDSSPGREYILTVEHTPVYTLGRHGHIENVLRRIPGVDVVPITRGGDITFHGPGQLVVYPIIDMQRHNLGVKSYIHTLEEAVIRLISEYGVKGERVEGATGVWIGVGTPRERKICAIGVKCSRFCTMHGLALNVNTDLGWFNNINPCGFTDKGVTSLALETGGEVDFEAVKKHFAAILKELLLSGD